MQTQKFFCQYSHGDLTTKVLSLQTFVLYGTAQLLSQPSSPQSETLLINTANAVITSNITSKTTRPPSSHLSDKRYVLE